LYIIKLTSDQMSASGTKLDIPSCSAATAKAADDERDDRQSIQVLALLSVRLGTALGRSVKGRGRWHLRS